MSARSFRLIAHPEWMCQYANEAEQRGLQVIIAGAGGAGASSRNVSFHDELARAGRAGEKQGLVRTGLPAVDRADARRCPVGTLAIGEAGAKNAALLAIRILANHDPVLKKKLIEFSTEQKNRVLEDELP